MVVVLGASLRLAKAGGCCPTVMGIGKLLREMLVAGVFMAVVVCRQYGDIVRKSWGANTGVRMRQWTRYPSRLAFRRG